MHSLLKVSLYRVGIAGIIFVLTSQFSTVSAAEFDIPLAELNKVKKKSPAKTATTKKRKQIKKQQLESETEQKPAVSSAEPAAEQTVSNQTKAGDTPVDSTSVPSTAQTPSQDSAPGKSSAPASVRISHTPYSFLVPGKRTVIQAVISSDTTITSAYCYFHAAGSSLGAAVSMSKTAGTRFTYTAVIPALNSESSGLSYKIYAVDANGATSQSKEYTIPTSSTAIFPGWQTDNFKETLTIQQDRPNTALEGFSDPAIGKK